MLIKYKKRSLESSETPVLYRGRMVVVGNILGAYTTSCNTQSIVPEYGHNNYPKHVEVIGIDKPFLHLVGCLYYLHFIIL